MDESLPEDITKHENGWKNEMMDIMRVFGNEYQKLSGSSLIFTPAVTSPSSASALGLPVHFDLALKAVLSSQLFFYEFSFPLFSLGTIYLIDYVKVMIVKSKYNNIMLY